MNSEDLKNALRDSVEAAPIQVAPIAEIHRSARQLHRRRAAAVAASVAVLSCLAVGGTVAAMRPSAPGPVSAAATAGTTSSASEAPSPSNSATEAAGDQTPVPSDRYTPAGYTELGACPDALAFLAQPEIQQQFKDWMGRVPQPQDGFKDGCPSTEDLQRMLDGAENAAASAAADPVAPITPPSSIQPHK